MHLTKALVAYMAMAVPLAAAAPAIERPANDIERRLVGDSGNAPSLYARDTLEARGRTLNGVTEVIGDLHDIGRNAKTKVRHGIGAVGQKVADKMYGDTATKEYAEVAARNIDESSS